MSQGRLLLLVLAVLLPSACGLAEEVDASLRNDAQLTDVAFVDALQGWAVGDRGTIWHTEDGGANWRLQVTHVDSRLSCVCFPDAKTGWAAGGYTHPYTHQTTGIVLRTRDGGEHWSCDRNSLLPVVRSLQFFDAANGIAVGGQSSLFPAGVFTTDDGGRSWSSLPPSADGSWLAGDFSDPLSGVLVGRKGATAMVRRKAIEPSQGADFGLRALHRVKLQQRGQAPFASRTAQKEPVPSTAWLVGDGGLVMQSDDAGATWLTPETEIPQSLRGQFDFHALDVEQNQIWIAGSPGTRVLHSPDGGRTWKSHATGVNTPIRSLAFIDTQTGWAVGDLGTILATSDGGRTWKSQRRGGERAALVGIFSEQRDVPLELFAKLSGDDGYLGVVELLHRTDIETPSPYNLDMPERSHEALVRAGASVADTAWRFPTRQEGLGLSTDNLIESWNRASDGRALERIDEHLVRSLRMWRPNVVFSTLTTSQRSDPRAQLMHQLALRAITHAADEKWYPEQFEHAGLAPWKITKVYGALAPGENGTANITSAQTTRNGRSVADLASPARGLIDRQYTPSPSNVGFRLVVDELPQEVGQKDFFSGIPLSPGGDARRLLRETPEQTVDAIRRSAQARRNLNAILARVDDRGPDNGRYLAEVTGLTRTMDPGHAAEVLLQLAKRYHDRGQWELAADTYDAIVTRYPKHPAAGAALVWLVQYYASGEADWRVGQTQQITRIGRSPSADGVIGEENEIRASNREVKRASAVLALGEEATDRASRASGYAKQLEQLSAALFAEPAVRFPLAAAQRARGYPREAERFFLGFVRNRTRDAWWDCAQMENHLAASLATRSGAETTSPSTPTKPTYQCFRTPGKPRLDGKLNDAVWKLARPLELKSSLRDDNEWPAVAMIAHDNEFLYLAITCREAQGSKYESTTGPRTRDADLTAQDRVELYLDLDRDYSTSYRLAVDARGWTNDSCWGDTTWNPKWFVAAARTGDAATGPTWSAEAAIPLSELSRTPSTAGQPWAMGLQRIAPNAGFQSWNQPAAVEAKGEGFGLIVFE